MGGRQGLVSNNHEKTTTWKKHPPSYGSSAFSFSGIMKNAMKDRNTDFHLAEASRNAWTSELPSFPPLLSFSVLSKTSCTSCLSWTSFWQLTTSFELIVLGQPLLSFSSGFGSRLGRVIKYVASSYTTRLETEQVLLSPDRRGGGGIRGDWGTRNLDWNCLGCLHDLMFTLWKGTVFANCGVHFELISCKHHF